MLTGSSYSFEKGRTCCMILCSQCSPIFKLYRAEQHSVRFTHISVVDLIWRIYVTLSPTLPEMRESRARPGSCSTRVAGSDERATGSNATQGGIICWLSMVEPGRQHPGSQGPPLGFQAALHPKGARPQGGL